MTDPTRLHEDETNSLGALLLRAGRDYAPPRARAGRIAAGIASAGAMIGGPSVAAASTTLAGAALGMKASGTALVTVLKWVGIGALSGLTVSVTATVVETNWGTTRNATSELESEQRGSEPGAAETATARRPSTRARVENNPVPVTPEEGARAPDRKRTGDRAPVRSTASRSPHPGKPSITPDDVPAAPAETEQQREDVAVEPNPLAGENTGSPSKTASDALREEVAALGLAKAALDRGAVQDALAHVSAYRVRFPRGHLGPEATYLEMEAEVLRGNAARARSLAAELTRVTSPNAKRVREVLQRGGR